MIVTCSETDPDVIYKLLISCIVPRPIAWVSSINNAGVLNLAPFSFFNAFCAEPPILGFACGYKDGPEGEPFPKDTLANVKENGEFVVNIVSRPLAEKMVQTSGEYDQSVSEFEIVDLKPVASHMVRPPRVGEALINFECKLFQLVELGGSCLVLGEVVCMHLEDEVMRQGSVDLSVLDPVGRLGGEFYATVRDRFTLARPRIRT